MPNDGSDGVDLRENLVARPTAGPAIANAPPMPSDLERETFRAAAARLLKNIPRSQPISYATQSKQFRAAIARTDNLTGAYATRPLSLFLRESPTTSLSLCALAQEGLSELPLTIFLSQVSNSIHGRSFIDYDSEPVKFSFGTVGPLAFSTPHRASEAFQRLPTSSLCLFQLSS